MVIRWMALRAPTMIISSNRAGKAVYRQLSEAKTRAARLPNTTKAIIEMTWTSKHKRSKKVLKIRLSVSRHSRQLLI